MLCLVCFLVAAPGFEGCQLVTTFGYCPALLQGTAAAGPSNHHPMVTTCPLLLLAVSLLLELLAAVLLESTHSLQLSVRHAAPLLCPLTRLYTAIDLESTPDSYER